jgi:hypothetical protein
MRAAVQGVGAAGLAMAGWLAGREGERGRAAREEAGGRLEGGAGFWREGREQLEAALVRPPGFPLSVSAAVALPGSLVPRQEVPQCSLVPLTAGSRRTR